MNEQFVQCSILSRVQSYARAKARTCCEKDAHHLGNLGRIAVLAQCVERARDGRHEFPTRIREQEHVAEATILRGLPTGGKTAWLKDPTVRHGQSVSPRE